MPVVINQGTFSYLQHAHTYTQESLSFHPVKLPYSPWCKFQESNENRKLGKHGLIVCPIAVVEKSSLGVYKGQEIKRLMWPWDHRFLTSGDSRDIGSQSLREGDTAAQTLLQGGPCGPLDWKAPSVPHAPDLAQCHGTQLYLIKTPFRDGEIGALTNERLIETSGIFWDPCKPPITHRPHG